MTATQPPPVAPPPADRAPQPAGLGWLDAALGAARLRAVRLLADQPDEVLAWIAARADVLRVPAGEALTRAGDSSDWLFITLEGEVRARREVLGAAAPTFVFRAGDLSGALPFSRMTHWPAASRAVVDSLVARFPRGEFDALLRLAPALEPRFVSLMADRVRDATARDQQVEKLAALGRLAAGLAHELNNPAAAAQRGTAEARAQLGGAVAATAALLDAGVDGATLRAVAAQLGEGAAPGGATDPLARADREDALRALLERDGVPEAWRAAAALADAGLEADAVRAALAPVAAEARAPLLAWLASLRGAEGALDVAAEAARRVGALVRDVRTYTNLDHPADPEPLDVRASVRSALAMLQGAFRARGVRLDAALGDAALGDDAPFPPVRGVLVSLNEVWSALLQNAAEAAPAGRGTVAVRVRVDADVRPAQVVVEVADDGPGVPDELRERVWEPFFTTKDVGAGTGLGLSIARRVVLEHGGEIALDSAPGETRVRVRLPVDDGYSERGTTSEIPRAR